MVLSRIFLDDTARRNLYPTAPHPDDDTWPSPARRPDSDATTAAAGGRHRDGGRRAGGAVLDGRGGDALSTPTAVEGPAIEAAYVSRNPHVEWFNWSHTGYTTVEFTANDAVYTAYSVDATVDSADAPRRLLRSYRVPEGRVELQEFDGPVTDAAMADDRSSED